MNSNYFYFLSSLLPYIIHPNSLKYINQTTDCMPLISWQYFPWILYITMLTTAPFVPMFQYTLPVFLLSSGFLFKCHHFHGISTVLVEMHFLIMTYFVTIHNKRKNNLILCTSIHPFSIPSHPSIGSRGGWSLSQWSSGERRGTPWTGRQSITGPHRDKRDKQPHMLILTPKDNLESPINLTCMFLDGGRKPEYPERCKLHTERPQVGIEPGTLLLWGDGAVHNIIWKIKRGEKQSKVRKGVTDEVPQQSKPIAA